MRTTPLILLFAASALAQPTAPNPAAVVRYDHHRLVRVTVRDARELVAALALTDDVWTCGGVGIGAWDARFSPDQYDALRASGIPHAVVIENLQARIDAENARLRSPLPRPPSPLQAADGPWFADFKNYAAISAYVDTLAALRPDIATRIILGQSLEGRAIFGLRITNDGFNPGRCKPAVVFNSNQHAREWIAPMVNMYAADRLVRDYGTDPVVTDLVNRVEFLFVPVVNPDGYQWSWDVDRYWRKNRRPNAGGSFGVDTNRNWGFQWGVPLPHSNAGNSNPTSQVYWGTGPFSEPETQVMRDFILARPQFRSHADIHSYGQLLLHPWCWTPTPSPDHALFQSLGLQFRNLILAVHNRAYTYGIWYNTLYPSSGAATDWVYGARGRASFTFELRGPDFVLPPTEIIPNSQEVYPALLHYADWTADTFPFKADFNDDCEYTVADFSAFQTAFVAGDPRADFNGDGQFTVADFSAFQSAWVAGQ